MCLSWPLKLKTSSHFLKWISLNIVFMTQHIHSVLIFFTALQPFSTYILLKGDFEEDLEFSAFNLNDFYWNSKVLSCSQLEVYFSFF